MSKSKESTYPYPSRFGSHRSMIVSQSGNQVECEDEFGVYKTNLSYIDVNMADPHRTAVSRLGKLFGGKKSD